VYVLFLAIMTPDATAWQVRNNDHGMELRWKQIHITYEVDPSNDQNLSDAAIDSMISAATRTWSQPVGDGLAFEYRGRAEGKINPHDNKNIIYFENDWDYDSSLVGLTFIWSHPDGEIVGFDMALNTRDHDWSIDGSPGENDLLNTITHEFGHALGVDHSPTVQTATMFPSTYPGELNKRDLHNDDERAVQYLYAEGPGPEDDNVMGCSTVGARGAAHLAWFLPLIVTVGRRQ